jgi:DNA-binding NtrC family response regulator
MQTRFLRALETGEFTPVGGSALETSDIRLVAATHRDLGADVEAGRFRQDLYYRLRVVVVPTPPLRERKEDIPVLMQTFLDQENGKHGFNVRGIARPALELLMNYAWPGNVRELRNLVSSIVVLKRSGMIEAVDLPTEILDGGSIHRSTLPVPLHRTGQSFDLELLATTLLEMRQELREIKAMLGGRLDPPLRHGQPVYGTPVVETFVGETGYSTEPALGQGDLESAERSLIEQALRNTGGRRREAAERLGVSERTLYRKLRKYGLR